MKTLYDDYYKYKELNKEYLEFRKECEPFNSLPDDEEQLSPFEIQIQNKEIAILTNIISNNIIQQNDEFSDLLNCKTEIDYMCIDVDINKFLFLILQDVDYYMYLTKVIRSNLWALKRIGRDPFANFYVKVKSFSIKDNYIHIKFKINNDKEEKRIKIDLYDLVWGMLISKDKTLLQIIYDEVFVAPIIN